MKRILFVVAAFLPSVATAEWRPVTADLIAAEKPGYGKLCGVVVDPASGDVVINLSDKGFYRSTDQGQTWKRTHEPLIKGRTEWPGCFQRDPSGKTKTWVAALVYGAPISVSRDDGQTWTAMSPKSNHVDWFAYDWAEGNFVLALKHESGDLLLASTDGGQTFRDMGKGFGPAFIFDGKTAVIAETKTKDHPQPRLLRTTDAGETTGPVGTFTVKAVPHWKNGKLYWLTNDALIASADRGQSFVKVSDVKDPRFGPVFGADENHMLVLTGAGIVESKDAGKSWSAPLALPKDLKGASALTWIGYDARNDIVYAMKMTSDLFQFKRNEK